MVADSQEQGDQQRNSQQHQPGAVGELAVEQHQTHHRGDGRPNPIHQGLAQPALVFSLPPVHHHAGLGEGEADEHPHRVERDQPGHAGVEDHQQQGGTATQGKDAVANDQPVPQGGQLAGQEAVLGQEGRQAREIGVGGVGGQQQDQQGGQLQQGQQHAIAEDQLTQLIQKSGAVLGVHDAGVVGQGADAAEHRGQQQHHHGEHLAGVAPLHRPEGRHAVADRLDAGEGGAAGAERPHQQHRSDRHQVTALGFEGGSQQPGLLLRANGGQAAAEEFDGSSHQHHHHHPHEQIGGEAEQLGAGAHAPQVGHHHQQHRHQAEGNAVGVEAGEIGGEGSDAGGHAHGHGEHVVDREGGARHQAGDLAEVVLRDPVGAAAEGISLDRLPVAGGHDQHQADDQAGDRQGEAQGGAACHPQHQHDLLGGVGHR